MLLIPALISFVSHPHAHSGAPDVAAVRPPPPVLPSAAPRAAATCSAGPSGAAADNARTLDDLPWASGRVRDSGWRALAPLIGREIGVACPPQTPAFAAALDRWQRPRRLAGGGRVDAATLDAFEQIWMNRRPFVAISARTCPAPPPPQALVLAAPDESFDGRPILLRARALAAWRGLAEAARRELPQARQDRRLFTLVSGFRSPAQDGARCQSEGDCDGAVRAVCSAHRTGLAVDAFLDAAPGASPTSSDPVNRRYIAGGAAYRWMVAHAGAFGFTPYPFEPWHWEWTGEAP